MNEDLSPNVVRKLEDMLAETAAEARPLSGDRVGWVAVSRGVITAQQLESALSERRGSGDTQQDLGAILLKRGWITEEDLTRLRREAAQLAEGRPQFERYEILDQLGEGGAAIVYRAWDRKLGREVALKVLRTGHDATRSWNERFQREAQVIAALSHPNVTVVYDAGEELGRRFVVMELVRGRSLRGLLVESKLPLEGRVALLEKVARAVDYAHGKGIVHRDLKPENILITEGGEPKVGDFGLAHLVGADVRLTRTRDHLGTPLYMAPEQVSGSPERIDSRTDVYAMGVMLFEMMCGRTPFMGETLAEVFEKIRHSDPGSPDGPTELATIACKAIDREPRGRYATAADFADDLVRWLRGEPVLAKARGPLHYAWRWISRRRRLAMTMGVTAALTVAAIWGWTTVNRNRAFDQERRSAREAHGAAQWDQAIRHASAALQLRDDAELRGMLAECHHRIDAANSDRRLQERIKPFTQAIHDLRLLSYIKDADFLAKLRAVELSLNELQQIVQAAEYDRVAEAWTTLGIGRYVVGDIERAEEALLHAVGIAPEDPQAHAYLTRIYLDRSMRAQITLSAEGARDVATKWAGKALEHAPFAASGRGVEEIERHLALTYKALAEQDGGKVDALCEEGLKRFGDKLGGEEYWCILALLRRGADKIEAYSKAIDRRPHYWWPLWRRGTARFVQKDYPGSLEDLNQVIAMNPRAGEAYADRGFVVCALGRVDEAMQDLDRAIQMTPDYVLAYLGRGDCRRRRGDIRGGIADYTELISRAPYYEPGYSNRAQAKHQLGDLPGALADYDKAVDLNPLNARTFDMRAALRRDMRDLEKALADHDTAVRLDSRTLSYRWERSVTRQRSGDADGAMEDLDHILGLDDAHYFAHYNRAILRQSRGDMKGAMADLDASIRDHRRFVEAYDLRAQVRLRMGDSDGALADFDAALSLKPKSAIIYTNRGRLRFMKADYDGAREDFDQAIGIDGRYYFAWAARGFLHLHVGRLEPCITDLTRVLELCPAKAPERAHWQETLDRARKQLEDRKKE